MSRARRPAPAAPAVLTEADVRFARCLPLVLAHEGGFVNHPADPGGATNLGISLRYARTRGSMFDLDGDGDVDEADIRIITVADAGPAYRMDFWDKVRGDELPPGIDYATFDFAVNSGPSRAIKALQKAAGAKVDGIIGPQTLRAVAAPHEWGGILERICAERLAFMRSLANWLDFRRGWTKRVEGVLQEAYKMRPAG